MTVWDDRYAHCKSRPGLHFDTTITLPAEQYEIEKKEMMNAFKKFLGKRKFDNVLEFGCGIAKYNVLFKNYSGVDIVAELIKDDQIKYADCHFELLQGEYQLKEYDLIFAISVLQHMEDNELHYALSQFKTDTVIIEEACVHPDSKTKYRSNEEYKKIFKKFGYKFKKEMITNVSGGTQRWMWFEK